MTSKVKDYFRTIVKYKATRMKVDEDYKSYRRELLKQMEIEDLDTAFMVGAIDAMIFDMAAALAIGPAYMKATARGKLIKDILPELSN